MQLKIEIKPMHKVLRDVAETMKAIKAGKLVESKRTLSFESVEQFRSFFTGKRLTLLRTIRQEKPGSVYELAKLLRRDLKSVRTDLTILSRLGVVHLRKQPAGNRYRSVPMVDFDHIVLEMAV